MGHRVRIIRPDDLLNLEIECVNLRLDTSDPALPVLVVELPDAPAFIVCTFAPQTLAEQAFFESSPTPPPTGEPPPDRRPTTPDGDDPPPVPGVPIRTRIGGTTRLVFRVASDASTRIPYAIDGLLDWSLLALNVSALAAIPAQPTAEQVRAAPLIRPPKSTDTIIELPYRLQLAPGANAAWHHSRAPVSHGGWCELWHTRLVTREDEDGRFTEPTIAAPAPLRAVWSQDFNPNEMPDPTELFVPDPDIGRTAMSAYDRKQIVALTCGFHGYVNVDKRNGRQTAFLPTPIQCERLMLSPLGGWLRSHGQWDPPTPITPRFVRPDVPAWQAVVKPEVLMPLDAQQADVQEDLARPVAGIAADAGVLALRPYIPGYFYELGPSLNLSEWVHVASQGRDHYVRVVYDGCLCGTDNPASLVKVTERRFRDIGGAAVAYLVQYMYVVVRQPEVDYAKHPIEHDGRSLPFTKIRLTTTVTPPIFNPVSAPSNVDPASSSFWVMVTDPATLTPVDFLFHGVGTDVAGHSIDFSVPLIFVPLGEQKIDAVLSHYRNDGSGRRRALSIPGQLVTFATPDPGSAADNTTLVTESILLGANPSASTRCGFSPVMDSADVRIPAVEQLLGIGTRSTITLNTRFLNDGFVGGAGVFADIAGGLDLNFSADQAGGIATPNLKLSCLSRGFGPLAGDVGTAALGNFDPAQFFPKGTAMLFGVIDLFELIQGGSIAGNAPKLVTLREDGGKTIVTTVEWQPPIRSPIDAGLLRFEAGADAKFTISGRIEQRVSAAPTPPQSRMHGELKDFSIEFVKAVRIGFDGFEFTTESGHKPQIDVQLAPADPIRFLGALEFVDELRKHIPPGLFGDGPSLDIDASRIRAGFSIALPPLTVAVFSLRNVSLGTALELPFSNGQPTFDFGFCERHRPFELAVALLGGGGFFHLQVDTAGIRQLEAALEFGAVAALDLGIASGSVHIMAGIYFAMNRDKDGDLAAMLSGYLRCGGELSVLGIISISVEFNLNFTYDDTTKKATGRATLTVEVEIAFFSASVELTVERSFGRDGGDPTFDQLIESPAVWKQYAAAFA